MARDQTAPAGCLSLDPLFSEAWGTPMEIDRPLRQRSWLIDEIEAQQSEPGASPAQRARLAALARTVRREARALLAEFWKAQR